MDLNKAMIIGNMTRDPEMRTTPNGQNVCSFSLATNRAWTDASGQKQEQAEFHNIVAWGKLAEICGQYLTKGRKVFVEGRIQTREWEAKDGTKRQRTEIVADNMIILDRAGSKAPSGSFSPGAREEKTVSFDEPVNQAAAQPVSQPAADNEIKVENIPF